uniref:Sulfotransferase n=1 Tax=Otolemur garnettii TaxID=30611 RepID=H0XZS2_OTOGA
MSDDDLRYEETPFLGGLYDPEILKKGRKEFVLKDEDVVAVTFPKSGTNWLIEILCLIHSKGDTKWIQSVPIWERSPWIESQPGFVAEGPRFLTSHLPIHLFPTSFFNSKAKVIQYVIRNPKDVIVSTYFFCNSVKLAKRPKSVEECLEGFLEEAGPYGSWFERCQAMLRTSEGEQTIRKVYDSQKKDTERSVEKICRFLGKKVEPEELSLILKNSSFEIMKENKMSNYSMLGDVYLLQKNPLMRKGVTGDWKNYFTVAQAEAFDKLFQERMADLPRELFPWE